MSRSNQERDAPLDYSSGWADQRRILGTSEEKISIDLGALGLSDINYGVILRNAFIFEATSLLTGSRLTVMNPSQQNESVSARFFSFGYCFYYYFN
jgi:hypothetical protein